MTAPKNHYRMTYTLVALNVLLALAAWHGVRSEIGLSDPDLPQGPTDNRAVSIEVTDLDAALGPIGRYSAVTEHPLFDASRRPPAPPEEPDTTAARKPVAPPEYTLDGVVTASGQRSALLKHQATSKVTRVTEGMQLEGWRVKTLEANRVVLEHRESEHVISLWKFGAAAAARSPPLPRQQPARHAKGD